MFSKKSIMWSRNGARRHECKTAWVPGRNLYKCISCGKEIPVRAVVAPQKDGAK